MHTQDTSKELKLSDIKKSKNVAELLDDTCLAQIGNQVVKGCEIDEESRASWRQVVDEAMEIAKQVMTKKNFPWENASNIKFPLIAQASIDYAARTMPEIIQNGKVVKAVVVGKDPDNAKYLRANRVSTFMSYQLMEQSGGWEDGTDMLLAVLPVMGTAFKKTYRDEIEGYNCSDICAPQNIIVNYDTQSLEKASRVTHIIKLSNNEIIERQRAGLFLECDIDGLEAVDTQDEDSEREFLEQHTFLDLDCDGYKEPYVVTVHKQSRKVMRIVHRFKNIKKTKDGKVAKIDAQQYFTDFHFIRSPDGGFYSMGFGSLLLPINKAINTLINQLIDSGTLNNMQGGLIGRGVRMKNGTLRFKMGEWQTVDAASGDDMRKSIFPWPTKEPSGTLFSLLGMLMQIGKDLSSTSDVLAGKQPAQNVASSTISQLVEQGTKVFVAINKRLYRSLKKEYRKLFELNAKYLTQEEYSNILDDEQADVKLDFELGGVDVIPVADPAVTTETQRIARAGGLQGLRTADPREVDRLFVEAMQLDADVIERLFPPADPNAPPPPEQQKLMAEVARLQAEIAEISAKATLAAEKTALEKAKLQQDIQESESRINESVARAWKMQQDALNNMKKLAIVESKMNSEQERKAVEFMHNVDKDAAQLMVEAQKAKLTEKPPAYSDDDIKYTSKLKGMTIKEVRKQLGVD